MSQKSPRAAKAPPALAWALDGLFEDRALEVDLDPAVDQPSFAALFLGAAAPALRFNSARLARRGCARAARASSVSYHPREASSREAVSHVHLARPFLDAAPSAAR